MIAFDAAPSHGDGAAPRRVRTARGVGALEWVVALAGLLSSNLREHRKSEVLLDAVILQRVPALPALLASMHEHFGTTAVSQSAAIGQRKAYRDPALRQRI